MSSTRQNLFWYRLISSHVVENVYGTFFLIDLVDLNVPTLINEWTHQRGGPKGPLGDKVPGNIIVQKAFRNKQ